ncbi:MAG: hypothetical protein LBP59_10975 [Planctomycetaceae bacterium]|jgi:hypothetical protein|nr:hypothetical protein [Planctomycetaceae bacterium]
MRIIRTMRVHKAIYWKKTGIDEFGQPTFETPIIIDCRWDSHSPQIDMNDTQDDTSNSMTVFPDRVLEVGSYLMFGGESVLAELTDKPPNIPAAYPIKSQKIVPRWKHDKLPATPDAQSRHVMIEVTL